MTDRDQQDRQAFEEWYEQNGDSSGYASQWIAFKAALRIAEERRKQELAIVTAWFHRGHVNFDHETELNQYDDGNGGLIPLILRDKEQP